MTTPPVPGDVLDVEAVRARLEAVRARLVADNLLMWGEALAALNEVDRLRAALRRMVGVSGPRHRTHHLIVGARHPACANHRACECVQRCETCVALAAARALLDGTDG